MKNPKIENKKEEWWLREMFLMVVIMFFVINTNRFTSIKLLLFFCIRFLPFIYAFVCHSIPGLDLIDFIEDQDTRNSEAVKDTGLVM